MSASLVGSEMCIRDRITPFAQICDPTARGHWAQQALRITRRSVAASKRDVTSHTGRERQKLAARGPTCCGNAWT
eukprot:13375164-Alexandrium_andersonii.AAC.1